MDNADDAADHLKDYLPSEKFQHSSKPWAHHQLLNKPRKPKAGMSLNVNVVSIMHASASLIPCIPCARNLFHTWS